MSEAPLPLHHTALPILPHRHVQVINVVSRKGGAGKTTMALLIARYLAEREEQPLVVVLDLDFSGTSLEDGIMQLGWTGPTESNDGPTTGLEEYLLESQETPGWELRAAQTLHRYSASPSTKAAFYFASSADRSIHEEEDDDSNAEGIFLGGAKAKELVRQRLHRLIRWVVERNGERRHFIFVLDNSPGIRGLGKELLDHTFAPTDERKVMPRPLVTWADVLVTTPDRQDLLASFRLWLHTYEERRRQLEHDSGFNTEIERERRAAENVLFLVNKLHTLDGDVRKLLSDTLPLGLQDPEYGAPEIATLIASKKLSIAHCSFTDGLARLFRGLAQAEIPPLDKYVPDLQAFLDRVDPKPEKFIAKPTRPSTNRSEYFVRGGRRIDLQPANNAIAISAIPTGDWRRARLRAQLESEGCYRTCALDSPHVEIYETPRNKAEELLNRYRNEDGVRFANHVYQYDAKNPENVLVLTDRLAVQFDPEMSLQQVEKQAAQVGLRLSDHLNQQKNIFLAIVRQGVSKSALEIANLLLDKKIALKAEPDWVRSMVSRANVPWQYYQKDQWHLQNDGFVGQKGADAQVLEAWKLGATGAGIKIAIIDTGIDIDHPQLAVPGKLARGYNAHTYTADPRPRSAKKTHGTMVAGVALAARNELNVAAGAAPDAQLIPILADDVQHDAYRNSHVLAESTYQRAFEYARKAGADIVNCSWGPPITPGIFEDLPLIVANEIDLLVSEGRNGKGALIFFAAGNHSESVEFDGWVSYENVMAIAASDAHDKKASYSNFGPGIFACAPSDPPGIITLAPGGKHTDDFGHTSSACALASGVAALVLSKAPDLHWTKVRDILAKTAQQIDKEGSFKGPDGETLSTEYRDGRSIAYGYGRLDATAAVKLAIDGG